MERKEEESVSAELERLSQEFEELKLQKETVEVQVKKLMGEEDPAQGVYYAQDIFRLQQDKLRLATEMEFRRRKQNRLRLAEEEKAFLMH